jgi:hypothetical protein
MSGRAILVIGLGLLAGSVVAAQEPIAAKKKPKPTECPGGVKYDDGSFENGYRPAGFSPGYLVQQFDAPAYPAKLDRVCINLRGVERNAVPMRFYIVVWKAEPDRFWPGPGIRLEPTTLIAAMPATASVAKGSQWIAYDISPANVIISAPVFIGLSWRGLDPYNNYADIFLSGDEGRRTPPRLGYYYIDYLDRDPPPLDLRSSEFDSWSNLYIALPKEKALAVRVIFSRTAALAQDLTTHN